MSTADDGSRFGMEITDGRTVITVRERRDVAVVVESAGGERVYLPSERERSERADGGGPASPYHSGFDRPTSSYGGGEGPASSYTPATGHEGEGRDSGVGRTEIPGGFRIVHPEPVTDVRIVRERAPV